MPGTEEKKSNKVYIGLYITFCVLFITWLTSKFFKGRRQIHQAFDVIGEQLQRMQDQLDQRREDEEGREIEYSNGGEDEKPSDKLCPVAENEPEKVEAESEKGKLKGE